MSDEQNFTFKDDFMDLSITSKVDPESLHAAQREATQFMGCFGTPDGQAVLKILKSIYYDDYGPKDTTQYGRFIGRRDVVQFILNRLEGMQNNG